MNNALIAAKHRQATIARLARMERSYKFRLQATLVAGQRPGKVWNK